jgi:hypothetical protein
MRRDDTATSRSTDSNGRHLRAHRPRRRDRRVLDRPARRRTRHEGRAGREGQGRRDLPALGCIPTKAFLQPARSPSTPRGRGVRRQGDLGRAWSPGRCSTTSRTSSTTNWKGLQATLKGRGVETIAGHRPAHRPEDAHRRDRGGHPRADRQPKASSSRPGRCRASCPSRGPDRRRAHHQLDHALEIDRVPSGRSSSAPGAIGMEFSTIWQRLRRRAGDDRRDARLGSSRSRTSTPRRSSPASTRSAASTSA